MIIFNKYEILGVPACESLIYILYKLDASDLRSMQVKVCLDFILRLIFLEY